ncbi:hypothetical protein [Desulfopila sp. IMCC35008]|nr:hypothetical protein [Desulfopila sp. IMCC35008]
MKANITHRGMKANRELMIFGVTLAIVVVTIIVWTLKPWWAGTM